MKKINKIISSIINNAYVFSVITKVLSFGLVMAYSVIYSRYMKPELKGVGDIIRNYGDLLMLVMCLGMYQAYPYFKKTKKEDVYNEFINLTTAMFLVYCLFAAAIIFIVKPNTQFCIVFCLVPLMFLAQQFNYAVLIENPKRRNISQIIQDLLDIVVVTGLMLITKSNYGVCIFYLLFRQFLHTIISVFNLKINPLKIRPSLQHIKKYVSYGIIPMITIILMEINYKADIVMLNRFHVSEAEIGVYSLGITLAQKIWLIPDAIKDILLSKLTSAEKKATIKEVAKVTRISLLMVFLFGVLIVVLAKPVIIFLYGAEYSMAYPIMNIIMIGILGMVCYKMVYSYNIVNGKRKVNLILMGIAAAINILMNYMMIPVLGVIGAAIASTVSYFLCGISFLIYFCYETKVSLYEMTLIKKEDIRQLINMFNL